MVAHECIIDLRQIKEATGVTVDDVAKRLIDFGFHAPTMSFPVSGTLMIEPTESESKSELDRFCEAMIAIREEIRAIETGAMDAKDNPLRNAPHTANVLVEEWNHPYSRSRPRFRLPRCAMRSIGRRSGVLTTSMAIAISSAPARRYPSTRRRRSLARAAVRIGWQAQVE